MIKSCFPGGGTVNVDNPIATPTTAVLLIAHNQAAQLRRAIAALERSQNRELIEILVVDCGSSDSTPALADEFPDITMQRLPQNFGATKALNIATRTARADFLFLLSPDVEVASDTISRLREVLETDTGVSAACPMLVDPSGNPVARTRRFPDRESLAVVRGGGELAWVSIPEETLAQERFAVMYPGREALLVRKQFVTGMNYFDERFGEYWADADLAIKIRQAGRRIEVHTPIKAIWHAPDEPARRDPIDRADRILGASALLSKHDGFFAGFGFRAQAILGALLRFDFPLLWALLGGNKVGSQAK
jgi:GT2 family glycosyltransferase